MIRILMTIIFICVLCQLTAQPNQNCQVCDRHGMLTEFMNPSNPDYEQKRQEWRDCMSKLLGNYVSFNADDPKVSAAAEQCAGFEPENSAYCYPEIISVYLGERLTNPCFHMLASDYFKPGINKEPEYIFKGSYEPNLIGGRIVEAVTGVFKPIIARMTLGLYYNGTAPELVKEWVSEGTLNSPKGLFVRLNIPKSINPLLDEFEKRPVSCDVKIPEPEEICRSGTAEIELSGFKDATGSVSKSFNRILVNIYKGEILNGENSDLGPDYKVFTIGEGTIKVKYKPPADKDGGYDWLRVYNSCEILPPEKASMSGTLTDEMIVDQHFPISCGFYEGTITFTKTWEYTKKYKDYSSRYSGSQTITVSGIFKPLPRLEGMEGQPVKIYGKGTAHGTWKHNDSRYCEGSGCGDCKGLVYEEYGSGSISSLTMDGVMITTNAWPTDNKIVAGQLKQFGMENWYDLMIPSETVEIQRRIKNDTADEGCQWSNSTTNEPLTECSVRFKLKDIEHLQDKVSWSSSKNDSAVSVTNLTGTVYDQEPFDPEQDGTDCTYTISWNLKAI
jgi:hypothetical protein